MDKLFVYGSLQPGGANEHVLADLDGRWEPGTVRGRLLDAGWGANMGYPGIILDELGPPVAGFVFSSESLASAWKVLDEFEGQEYQRCLVPVQLQAGGEVVAHIYALKVTD